MTADFSSGNMEAKRKLLNRKQHQLKILHQAKNITENEGAKKMSSEAEKNRRIHTYQNHSKRTKKRLSDEVENCRMKFGK